MGKQEEDLGTMASGVLAGVTTGELARAPVASGSTYAIHDPFLNKTVEINNNLTDRLRGKYANGPTMPNGEPEFGWREYPAPPIQKVAADVIDNLTAAREPFGEIDGEGSDDFPDNTKVIVKFGRTTNHELTLGDFRRARVALSKAKAGGG